MFVLAFDNTDNGDKNVERNSHTKYFLPIVNISFYDQSINDQFKRYDETRKTTTRQWDDYTTKYLLDYQCFKDHYQPIAIDLSKQKELDADSRAIQQIEFYGMLNQNSKEAMPEFYKGTAKVLWIV